MPRRSTPRPSIRSSRPVLRYATVAAGALLLAGTAAACGSNNSSSSSPTSASSSGSTSATSTANSITSTKSAKASSQLVAYPKNAKPVTITINTDLDDPVPGTNKTPYQFWIPAFEKLYPNIHVKVIASTASTQDQALYDRIVAAEHQHAAPPVNITDSSILPQMEEQHYGVTITKAEVPLMDEVEPTLLKATGYEAIPFRGSSVVLAYNSTLVSKPPTSLSGLLAWIRSHPGKFTYNTPGSGGSGEGFVQAVLNEGVPAAQENTFATGYKASLESDWAAGLKTLAGLKADIYHNGFYPDGNTATLQLLANGAIDLAPAWSDQATSALADHDLPPTVKLQQLNPPFPGGPADLMVVKGSANQEASFAFINFMLTAEGQTLVAKDVSGYPGTEWKYAPAAVRKEFGAIATTYAPAWAAQFTNDLAQKWQNSVAAS